MRKTVNKIFNITIIYIYDININDISFHILNTAKKTSQNLSGHLFFPWLYDRITGIRILLRINCSNNAEQYNANLPHFYQPDRNL